MLAGEGARATQARGMLRPSVNWLRMQEALNLWALERESDRYKHIEPVAV
jgi:hypothetical protein